ncbi:MAG: 1-(5-phosphoribosyl)-5-[Oscillospiraceae bacterium]|nr:1-(5-phosphoribosyl)-5-[(5-phosphoribosylamino)methylideneamino]imidazole-4-carboxamide isomerase [Oscillospiraceae bacterium]
MIILPAIDIYNGMCVRLKMGDFGTSEKVADDYMKTAQQFVQQGAEWIHMVDLDGAKEAKPKNSKIFLDVAANTPLKVELGGGIRDMETIDYYLENGISRVILGSAALSNPQLVRKAVEKYGERIAVGIDAKNEMVAADGWLDTSTVHFLDLARAVEASGVKYIIYTDISKDGTLSGPNLEHLERLKNAVSCNIIASGGIHNINDIKNLKNMDMYGAICGKSIYKGTLSLADAVRISKEAL